MKHEIPDELGQEVAKLAAQLHLEVGEAVRQALESWVKRVRRGRQPDEPVLDEMISPPLDLPHSQSRLVRLEQVGGRIPDGVGLGQ